MAYDTSYPPTLLVPATGGGGATLGKAPQLWGYTSGDADGTVNGADYFSDGDALGMQVGDFVFVWDTGNDIGSVVVVSSVTAGGAATTQFAVVS